jgi:hypothetical protein
LDSAQGVLVVFGADHAESPLESLGFGGYSGLLHSFNFWHALHSTIADPSDGLLLWANSRRAFDIFGMGNVSIPDALRPSWQRIYLRPLWLRLAGNAQSLSRMWRDSYVKKTMNGMPA